MGSIQLWNLIFEGELVDLLEWFYHVHFFTLRLQPDCKKNINFLGGNSEKVCGGIYI